MLIILYWYIDIHYVAIFNNIKPNMKFETIREASSLWQRMSERDKNSPIIVIKPKMKILLLPTGKSTKHNQYITLLAFALPMQELYSPIDCFWIVESMSRLRVSRQDKATNLHPQSIAYKVAEISLLGSYTMNKTNAFPCS